MEYDISIIVPVYNDWIYFNEMLLPSLINQGNMNFELIVVDDGSDPKYDNLKPKSLDSKISDYFHVKYLESKRNCGANVARNLAFNLCSGENIMFSDADVYFFPGIFKKMKDELDRDESISFVYSDFFWKNEKDGRLIPMRAKNWSPEDLYKQNYISFCSLVRREEAGYVMPLDPEIKRLQDWDFWLSMMEKGLVGKYIEEFLFIAMLKKRGVSAQSTDDYVRWYKEVLEKHPRK